MYGYVKQPDGVLKPILLKNIKNIVVSGNSLDVVYFSVGTTPLEVPKVDQAYYFNTKKVKACSAVDEQGGEPIEPTFKNDIYTFGDTDFVNGDIKINFGNSNLDLHKVFTGWMNSILSGKVPTAAKTLNEFAPSLDIGYVFSNESSLPTALLQPVINKDGEDVTCEPDALSSQTVFVAADLVANPIPLVGTHIYDALFDDATLRVGLSPVLDGKYNLYQFIAPTEVASGGLQQPECDAGPGQTQDIKIWDNLLSPGLDNVVYEVQIRDGAITSITVCPEVIQYEFSPLKQATAFGWTNNCGEWEGSDPNGGGAWPVASSNVNELECGELGGNCLSIGDTYQFSEYWVRQESGDVVPGQFAGFGSLGSFYDKTTQFPNAAQPSQQVTVADIGNNNAGSIIVPTTNTDNSYPARIYSSILNGTAMPEFGITGINMNILEIPEVNNPSFPNQGFNGYSPTFAAGKVLNGVPTTTGNLYRLANAAGDSLNSQSAGGSPMHWDNGSPSFAATPAYQGGGLATTLYDLSYSSISLPGPGGFTYRARFLHRPSTWRQIFSPTNGQMGEPSGENNSFNDTYFYALQQAGVIPTGEAQYGAPPELAHNIKIWFRDKIFNPDTGAFDVGEWIEFTPAMQVATGLPFGMVNNVQLPGNPMQDPFNIPRDMMTIPFAVEETNPELLSLGFTHRAFGVGSYSGFTGAQRTIQVNGPMGPQNKNIYDIVQEDQNQRSIKGKFRGWDLRNENNTFVGNTGWDWDVINFPQSLCPAEG